MPDAPDMCVKVYLYGLYKCSKPDSADNNLESIAKILNLSEDDVVSAFYYWEDRNLVQIISKTPLEVRYLPAKLATDQFMKFNPDKYKAFNIRVQEIIDGRMIGPLEYQEYYYLIENRKIDPDALCMIIKYCVGLKGNKIASSYILTVAKNWIYDGILTCEAVEERLLDLERTSDDVKDLLKSLGVRRKATEAEYSLYITWKRNMDISQDIILHLAKKVKAKGGGFNMLDSIVSKCYSLKLTSIQEIDDYYNNLQDMYDLAKNTCKALGLRYENVETIVDTYIAPWINLGFEAEAILKIANYCFRYSVRSLEGLNGKLNQLYKLGLLTAENIDDYLVDLAKNDDTILHILQTLGLDRGVISSDRNMYNNWTNEWQMSEELIDFALKKSVGMSMPMQYLNKLLSTFYTKKISTIEEAENLLDSKNSNTTKPTTKSATCDKAKGKEYSKQELNSLINNLFEVEI